MKLDDILSEIKIELTGYILDLEITDETLVSVVNKALRELARYIDETTMISVPYASCIDLDGEFFAEKVSSIVKVYRTEGTGDNSGLSVVNDPIQMAQFAIFSNGGTMYNLNDYVTLFGVDSRNQHTTGLTAHHLSGGQVGDGNQGLADQFFGLVELGDTGEDLAIGAGAIVQGELQQLIP